MGPCLKLCAWRGQHGAMICVHAENGQVIQVLVEEAVAAGRVAPKYHSLTRPTLLEGEATHRAIKIAELAETPLYIVHLSAHRSADSGGRGARRRAAGARRNLSALPVPDQRRL